MYSVREGSVPFKHRETRATGTENPEEKIHLRLVFTSNCLGGTHFVRRKRYETNLSRPWLKEERKPWQLQILKTKQNKNKKHPNLQLLPEAK